MTVKTEGNSGGANAAAQAVRDAARVYRLKTIDKFEESLSTALIGLPDDGKMKFLRSLENLGQATKLIKKLEAGNSGEELEATAQLKKAREGILSQMRGISEDGYAAVCEMLKAGGENIGPAGKQ